MKLLLVYPKIATSNTNTHTYSVPLGLGSIATYSRQRLGDLEVKILDGSLMSHEEQVAAVREFKPDVTGINTTVCSHRNGLEIGEHAKEEGSLVFFGGVNSTNLWEQVLASRPFVDGVVLYEGEIPMYLALNRLGVMGRAGADCLDGIPNLAYRDSGGNIHPPSLIYVPSMGEIPDIDYTLFDLDRFFKQTQEKGFGKAITYHGGKGCPKRSVVKLKRIYRYDEYMALVKTMNACTFCGRNELGLKYLGEEREARVVIYLHDELGVRWFFNVQDEVDLRNKTPAPIGLDDSKFRLFIGLRRINEENIGILKQRYGPHLIFQAGVEAATPGMRVACGKSPSDSFEVLTRNHIMDDNGIESHTSHISGEKGHTRDSIRQTSELTMRLAECKNVTWILVSPLLVIPGSPDYGALLQMPGMAEKYADQDSIDIVEASNDFHRFFTPELTREDVIEEIKYNFDCIRSMGRTDLVLDVKGVTPEEEDYINPNRRYAEAAENDTKT